MNSRICNGISHFSISLLLRKIRAKVQIVFTNGLSYRGIEKPFWTIKVFILEMVTDSCISCIIVYETLRKSPKLHWDGKRSLFQLFSLMILQCFLAMSSVMPAHCCRDWISGLNNGGIHFRSHKTYSMLSSSLKQMVTSSRRRNPASELSKSSGWEGFFIL